MFSVCSFTLKANSASELELQAFGLEQRGGLLDEGRFRLSQDADEVVDGERLQLDADGEAALQLWDQVARLRDVEGAGGDEEDVVGRDHAVLGIHRRALDDGQDVALHAFARDVGTVAALAPGDLVDLVEEDDAGVFDALDGEPGDLVHVDQALLFFLDEVVESLGYLHLALLGALAEEAGKNVLEVYIGLIRPILAGCGDELKAGLVAVAHVELDHAFVELAFAELRAQLLAGALLAGRFARGGVDLLGAGRFVLGRGYVHRRRQLDNVGAGDFRGRRGIRRGRGHRRQQQVEQAIFGVQLGLVFDIFELLFADEVDRDLDEVADDGFDVAPDVADLGELARFNL